MNQNQGMNLNIEELHLDGLSGVSIDRLHADIERELAHMIQHEGLPYALQHQNRRYSHSSDAAQQLTSDVASLPPKDMAKHIAKHLYQGWHTQQ